MDEKRLAQLKRNATFITKYIGGEHIDSRLVSKFISTVDPCKTDKILFRVELHTGERRKIFRRRVMSTSDCKFGAAKGCMSMLHYKMQSTTTPLFDGRNVRLNVYEIKNAHIYTNFEEIVRLGVETSNFEMLAHLDHLEIEREFLIRPPENLVLVDQIEMGDSKHDDIYFYE